MRPLLLALFLSLPSQSLALPPAPPVPQVPSLAPLIDSVKSAVVNLDVAKRASQEQQEMMDRYFRRRRGPAPEEGPLSPGTGSGFIIDTKGLVLTNNHVVDGAVTIKVRLDDGRSFDGEVVGRDPLTDVALVKLKGKLEAPLPAVKLGDSGSMRAGDWVVAIGNPFGLAQSVSAGIISALDRQIGASRYDQFLQTDAAINPGNSGGPLFNLQGEVIGMNTAIIGAASGIGFAVPSNLIKAVVGQLEKTGTVTRGWLGVGIQDVSPALSKALLLPANEGALIASVNDGSPAQKAGLKEEDVVLAIDGEKVASSSALTRAIALKRPDSTVALLVVRQGKSAEMKVKLGLRPDVEHLGDSQKQELGHKDPRRFGLSFEELDQRGGALIVDVAPGSPAEEAGLQKGMAVVELNRKPIAGVGELMTTLKAMKPGTIALFRVVLPGSTGKNLIALEVP